MRFRPQFLILLLASLLLPSLAVNVTEANSAPIFADTSLDLTDPRVIPPPLLMPGDAYLIRAKTPFNSGFRVEISVQASAVAAPPPPAPPSPPLPPPAPPSPPARRLLSSDTPISTTADGPSLVFFVQDACSPTSTCVVIGNAGGETVSIPLAGQDGTGLIDTLYILGDGEQEVFLVLTNQGTANITITDFDFTFRFYGACKKGYKFDLQRGQCIASKTSAWATLFVLVLLMLAVLLPLYAWFRLRKRRMDAQQQQAFYDIGHNQAVPIGGGMPQAVEMGGRPMPMQMPPQQQYTTFQNAAFVPNMGAGGGAMGGGGGGAAAGANPFNFPTTGPLSKR